MKRTYALILLAILAINSAGFYVYYVVELQRIHANAKAQLKFLPDDSLQILKLSTQEYKAALVNDHEVKVEGKMYDIGRVKRDGENVLVYCIHDEAEDNLIAFIERVLTIPLEEKSSFPNSVHQFISLTFIVPNAAISFNVDAISFLPHTAYLFSSSLPVVQIQIPPPRV